MGHYIDYKRVGVFFSKAEHLSFGFLYTCVKASASGLTDGKTSDFCSCNDCYCGFLSCT